jgi:hypothetical protein
LAAIATLGGKGEKGKRGKGLRQFFIGQGWLPTPFWNFHSKFLAQASRLGLPVEKVEKLQSDEAASTT